MSTFGFGNGESATKATEDDQIGGLDTTANTGGAGGCCSKFSLTRLSKTYPVTFALLNALIYYVDFATDVDLAVKATQLAQSEACIVDDYSPPTVLPQIIVIVICFCPVAMSAADLLTKGGMGLFGVFLNVTNTRMLYAVYKAIVGDGGNAAAAAKSANDVKLFEAVLESMPQAHLQFIYLLFYPDCIGGVGGLYRSLAISTLSIVFALVSKFDQLFNQDGKAWSTLAACLYFACDVVSRCLAVAMLFGAFGGARVAAFAGGWIGVDVVWQWLGNRKEWGDVKRGKCGMRCCMDMDGDCCFGGIFECACHAQRGGWCSLWGTTFPFASLPSTLLSLFTSMPLSTKKRDRTRLFFLSTSVTLAMALCATFLDYQALLEQPGAAATPFSFSNAIAINGSGEAGGAVGSGGAAASGEAADLDETTQTAESASLETLAVVFATLALKALAYLFGLRGGVLEKGPGAQEAAGFSALFALSDVAGDQMESWTSNEWATFFKDPANTERNCSDCSAKGFSDGVGKNIGVGLQLAGADCKVVELDLGWNNLGDAAGVALAKAIATNSTLQKIDLSDNNLGDSAGASAAGVVLAKAIETNTTLQWIDLRGNDLGDSAGVALANVLENNTTLQTIDLANNNLGPAAGVALAKAIDTNTMLQTIDLGGNNLGDAAGVALANALETNSTLRTINLSYNNFNNATKAALNAAWGKHPRTGEIQV